MSPASRSPGNRQRILVLGYVVRRPFGGQAWHYLQYLLGLAELGHEVYYLETSGTVPDCLDPVNQRYGPDASTGLQFLQNSMERLGHEESWSYHDQPTGQWTAPCAARVAELGRTADMVVNVSGLNPLHPWFAEVPVRCLIDTDPVFTQIRHLEPTSDPDWSFLWGPEAVGCHNAFFSFGENFGRAGCGIPDDRLPWQPTRQPVVLSAWPNPPPAREGRFTSVLSWQTYRAREYGGQRFGTKQDSFVEYLDLPSRVGAVFEVALRGKDAPRERLHRHGWVVCEPGAVAEDPWKYQDYLGRSRAEFGVAKQGYVVSRSGWFSERSAAYLAMGKPVIVQETGFSDWLKADQGVLSFTNPREAAAAIREVENNYPTHCRAAREVAGEYFDARIVLERLLEQARSAAQGFPTAGKEPGRLR